MWWSLEHIRSVTCIYSFNRWKIYVNSHVHICAFCENTHVLFVLYIVFLVWKYVRFITPIMCNSMWTYYILYGLYSCSLIWNICCNTFQNTSVNYEWTYRNSYMIHVHHIVAITQLHTYGTYACEVVGPMYHHIPQ